MTESELAQLGSLRAGVEGEGHGPGREGLLEQVVELHRLVWSRLPPLEPWVTPSEEEDWLARMAGEAIVELGAVPERSRWSLREYDADRYGPLLGVSDDGDAAAAIVAAFHASPKAEVLRERGELTPESLGGCLDAERMSAAGELLVGPPEYSACLRASVGRALLTTNVGTVVLPRFYRTPPQLTYKVRGARNPMGLAISALRALLAPYAGSSGLPAREMTAYVAFRGADRVSRNEKVRVLRELQQAIESGHVGHASAHRLGLLQRSSDRGSRAPKLAIDIALEAGLREVLIEGDARYESQDQLLLPGLLAFYSAERVVEILEYAAARGVSIGPKNRIDVATASRTIWAGLTAARVMSAALGKYGLFPLTLEQQLEAMATVQPLLSAWTSTPAFYVDRPIVALDGVFGERGLVGPAIAWLRGAAGAGASVVLFDAPDRTPAPAGSRRVDYHDDRGRRLIKRADDDSAGVFAMADVFRLLEEGRRQDPPVRILWAGGLDGEQAYELAGRGAFGIYTTSTTARRVAVGRHGDPSAVADVEPTYLGVLAVKSIIEAGFLTGPAAVHLEGENQARAVDAIAPVLSALRGGLYAALDDSAAVRQLESLRSALTPLWRQHLDRPAP